MRCISQLPLLLLLLSLLAHPALCSAFGWKARICVVAMLCLCIRLQQCTVGLFVLYLTASAVVLLNNLRRERRKGEAETEVLGQQAWCCASQAHLAAITG